MKIFSNFANIFSNESRDLRIDIQPQLIVPIIKSEVDETLETIPIDSLIEAVGKKNISLSLEFSLKHIVINEKEPFDISNIFPFERIKVTLIRYTKIISSEVIYKEWVHKPKLINLPRKSKELYGFKLYVSTYSLSFDLKNLRKGCQVISLYSNVPPEERNTVWTVKNAIEKLGFILGVDLPKDGEDYAFQFCITKRTVDDTVVMESDQMYVLTEMFKIIGPSSGSFLTTQVVSADDYYIPGYNVEQKKSEDEGDRKRERNMKCIIS